MEKEMQIPIAEKQNLTLQEASEYSNIGIHRLRSLTNEKGCPFVLFVGNKRLIKRKQFDEFIKSIGTL